jgi:hypothetical protein
MSNVPASLALNLRHGVPSIRNERIVLWHAVPGSWFLVLSSWFLVLFKPKEGAQYYLAVYMTAG